MSIRISYSSVSDFSACAYLYYLKKVLGYEKVGIPRPLGFGSAFHLALEAGNRSQDRRLAHMTSVLAWEAAATKFDLCPEDVVIGKVLLRGYWAMYEPSGGTAESEVLVELPGPADPSGVELHAIIDVLGDGFAEEHKTTTQLLDSEKYWSNVDKSLQVNTYFIAAELIGKPIQHLVWDVIRAPMYRRRTATPLQKREFYQRNCAGGKKGDPKPGTYLEDETIQQFEERFTLDVMNHPSDYFCRKNLYRTQEDLEKTRYDLWSYGKLMEFAIANGSFPRNTQNCYRFNRPCDFYDVCHSGVDPAKSDLFQIRKRDTDEHVGQDIEG